jgi:hypothetical protein
VASGEVITEPLVIAGVESRPAFPLPWLLIIITKRPAPVKLAKPAVQATVTLLPAWPAVSGVFAPESQQGSPIANRDGTTIHTSSATNVVVPHAPAIERVWLSRV